MNELRVRFGHDKSMTVRYPLFGILALYLISTAFNSDVAVYGQSLTKENIEDPGYDVDSLFIALLTNGDASIDYNLVINSDKPSTNITLFGETVQNLTLTDYNESDIEYTRTEFPNKVKVYSRALPDIHVTYTTPDLVDKQNRNWTFSFFFPDRFLLKIPSQARIIHMDPPAFLTPTGEQNLWGFGPGNVQVSYVIGPLGTKEEAQASIRSVEDAINDARMNYDGIVLNNTTFLDKAKSAFKQGKYLEVVSYSTNALNSIQNTGQNYVLAKQAISQAEVNLENRKNIGYNTSEGDASLSKGRSLFLAGEYEEAENLAKLAITKSSPTIEYTVGLVNRTVLIILGFVAAVTTILIFLVIRKRKISLKTVLKDRTYDRSSGTQEFDISTGIPDHQKNYSEQQSSDISIKVQDPSPLHLDIPADSPRNKVEIKRYLKKVVEEVGSIRKKNQVLEKSPALNSYHIGDQLTDKEWLEHILSRIKSEKPYLREDDKNLLDYLCEKKGTAFESEIRNKFILPRTSLWRLIKRLEREDLVEIIKIGGQNLIKLKFENKPK